MLAIYAINKERSSRESIARKVQFSREQIWISRTPDCEAEEWQKGEEKKSLAEHVLMWLDVWNLLKYILASKCAAAVVTEEDGTFFSIISLL